MSDDKQSGVEEEQQNDASVEEEVEQIQPEKNDVNQKYSELQEKYVRLYADFENFKKRYATEREQTIKQVKVDLVISFLPCIDDIELAIDSAKSHKLDSAQMSEGLSMMHKKMISILENSWNIQLLGTEGQEFDPVYHEAIGTAESTEHASNSVLQVYQKGYQLHDRVIRPAKVLVSKKPENEKKQKSSIEDVKE